MSRVVVVPPFYCPLDSAVHPQADELGKRSVAFMDKYRLYWDDAQRDRLVGTLAGLVTAYQCPDAPLEHAQLVGDLMLWAFCYDDEVCDEPPGGLRTGETARTNLRLLRAAESLEHPPGADHRYACAVHDLRTRFSALLGPEAGDQFSRYLGDYISMEMHKAAYKTTHVQPSLSEVATLRLWGGGATLFPHAYLLIRSLDTRPDVSSDRCLRALVEAASLIGGWDNDIYSVNVETTRAANTNELNIVDVIAREQGLDIQSAMEEATRMRDRIMTLYLRLRERLTRQDLRRFTPYTGVLDQYLRGHLDWALKTARYESLGSDASTRLSGFTPNSRDDSPQPLPIDAIRWWWHV
ncbi:terpene synthase family protein [Streptomyces sp. NPDC055078]